MEKSPQYKSQYYRILGLEKGATRDEIKKAYRRLSLKYHPDHAPVKSKEINNLFIEITKAYHILLDIEKPEFFPLQPLRYAQIKPTPRNNWRNRKKMGLWSGITLILFFVIISASVLTFRRNAMLKGLQQSQQTTFVAKSKHSRQLQTPHSQENREKKEIIAATEESIPPETEKKEEAVVILAEDLQQVYHDEPTPPLSVPSQPQPPILQPEKSENFQEQPAFAKEEVVNSDINKTPKNIEEPDSIPGEIDKTSLIRKARVIAQPERTASYAIEKKQLIETILVDPPEQSTHIADTNTIVIKNVQKKLKFANVKQQPLNELTNKEINKKVAIFLISYINAYEKRDINKFIDLFTDTATENGVPVATSAASYKSFFNSTSQLRMRMNMNSRKKIKNNTIRIRGRYYIDIVYISEKRTSREGQISFTLEYKDDKLLIQRLDYSLK